jgi:voltage-gated potassium channel Kch
MAHAADNYGLVLALVLATYVAVSAAVTNPWWIVGICAMQGLTLFVALHTSRARPLWLGLAAVYLVGGTLVAIVSIVLPAAKTNTNSFRLVGGLLLLIAPVAIARRIATHEVVTTQTVLGAICIYMLLGYCFASIFDTMAHFSQTPFFVGVPHAPRSAYLFFSYTTLTTVGYGNLVPAEHLGQTFAVLEALLGQIFLVTLVARLVSLWGQARPGAGARRTKRAGDAPAATPPADE